MDGLRCDMEFDLLLGVSGRERQVASRQDTLRTPSPRPRSGINFFFKMSNASSVALVEQCLEELRSGNAMARDRLLLQAMGRLRRLSTQMLNDFPRLQRWEDADDVLQNAMLRLCRALELQVPESVLAFYRLAALQIRRELLDLCHHYFGPQGLGQNYVSSAPWTAMNEATPHPAHEAATDSRNPALLADWTEFHQQVESLPDAELAHIRSAVVSRPDPSRGRTIARRGYQHGRIPPRLRRAENAAEVERSIAAKRLFEEVSTPRRWSQGYQQYQGYHSYY